jgi:hypothetical protein
VSVLISGRQRLADEADSRPDLDYTRTLGNRARTWDNMFAVAASPSPPPYSKSYINYHSLGSMTLIH